MFSRLFRASNTIASGAIVLGLFSLVSRLIGLYRDRLLAGTFGAGEVLDAYYAAFRLPDFIFNIIVLGALSAGFIPIFSELLKQEDGKAWRFSQAVLLVIGAALVVLCVVLFVSMPALMPIIAPGFSPATNELAVNFSRVMVLSPFFLGLSSVFGGVVQSYKRFFAYALAPIFYNAGIILGIVLFAPVFGPIGLAWGVVCGSFLHLVLQAVVAQKLGWQWLFVWPWKEAGLREIAALMGPRTLSIALTEATTFIVTFMASGLSKGSLTLFNLAHNLAHVPIGLFGISFAVAAFPALSEAAAEHRQKKFRKLFHRSLSSLLFFVVPTVALVAAFSKDIVSIVLGTGKFTPAEVSQTAIALVCMVAHMAAQSIVPIYTRNYYAQKNTWYPLFASALGVASNAAFAYVLSLRYGVAGLSLSLSLASSIQLAALILGPHVKASYLALSQMRQTMLQTGAAGAVMFITMWSLQLLARPELARWLALPGEVFFLAEAALGVLVYGAVLHALGSTEYEAYKQIATLKLKSLLATAPTPSNGVDTH